MRKREKGIPGQAAKRAGRLALLCLTALAAGLLTACGGDGKEQTERSRGIDGFVYMAQEAVLPEMEDGTSLSDMIFRNGSLYYKLPGFYSPVLMKVPMEELTGGTGEGTQIRLQHIPADYDDYNLMDWTVGNEGDIYYCVQGYHRENRVAVPEEKALLIRQGADGSLVWQAPVSVPPDEGGAGTCSLAVDGGERIYVQTAGDIQVMDALGNLIGTIDKTEYESSLVQRGDWEERATFLEGAEGRLYLCIVPLTPINTVIYEVMGEGCRLEERRELTEGSGEAAYYGSPYGLLRSSREDGLLYQYSQEDLSWHGLLRWSDGGVSGNAFYIAQLTEDYIAACYLALDAGTTRTSLYLLTRTDVAQLPEKEVLVLASREPDRALEEAVMGFNQASDRYHVILDVYGGDEAVTRLDAALVSSNPPDLLDTHFYLDLTKYAEKGVVEDLTPYLEQSEALSRENFLPNLLEGYTIAGRLCCIPSNFSLAWAVMGRSDQVGSEPGWTMEDMMALTERYPDCRLLEEDDFFSVLELCADYILEEYIDWENSVCHFDTARFRETVQWIREHSGQAEQSSSGVSYSYVGAISEDVLLAQEWVTYPGMYGIKNDQLGGAALIGYPTVDGRFLQRIRSDDEVCIIASSEHKEGAWAFIEYLLTHKSTILYSTFYSDRELLRQEIEKEATPQYQIRNIIDEEGNVSEELIYGADGKPELQARSLYIDQDGEQREYYYLEREQADALLEALEQMDCTPRNSRESAAYQILVEELDAWLASGKPLEETVGSIQSRVQLMLEENR